VATDDARIQETVESFGGHTVMTSPEHASGTDRIAEALRTIAAEIVVNIQGDQPFIDPAMIDECVEPLFEDDSLNMSTLMHPIEQSADLTNTAVVKVVADLKGNALYFSRSLIPHPHKAIPHRVFEHVGLYAYRREFLFKLARLKPTPLEQIESLEQLRALENGHRIRVVETRCADNVFSGFSVDTEEDLLRAERMLAERAKG
jgi:3-deoxy-manno-octulosonate cytidylyltransferase (CMP-KDO synthetase)